MSYPNCTNADVEYLNQADILLVYDTQCPFCENYCQLVTLRKDVGNLVLIDAREDSVHTRAIKAQGLDLNEGMVVIMGDQLYHGADAIHVLALMSGRSGFFNKLNYWCFRSALMSSILYPVLRGGRNLILRMLGRSKIQ